MTKSKFMKIYTTNEIMLPYTHKQKQFFFFLKPVKSVASLELECEFKLFKI